MSFEFIGYIVSAIPGIASLYLYWKKLKKDNPDLQFHIVSCSYKTDSKNDKKGKLRLDIESTIENKGNASGSLTDVIASIRYSGEVLRQYPFVQSIVKNLVMSNRPKNYNSILPITVPPYGSSKLKSTIEFDDVHAMFLDRCGVTLDIKKPKKWEWNDLPILIQLNAKTTNKTIKVKSCVFREDIPESKNVRGCFDPIEHANIDFEFMPKIGDSHGK